MNILHSFVLYALFMPCNLNVGFSVVFYVVANSTGLFPLKNYLVDVGEVLQGW